MPVAVTHYRVFIASPSGLGEERKAFRDTISRFNARDGNLRRTQFDAVGWEMTLGQQGAPASDHQRGGENVRLLLPSLA